MSELRVTVPVLQLAVLQPSISQGNIEGASLGELLRDPYIIIAAGAITFANLGIAVLEPSLPLWLMDTMHAPKWQQGTKNYARATNLLILTLSKYSAHLRSFRINPYSVQ